MRISDPILESLFPTVRKEVLRVLMRTPGRAWYMGSLASKLGRQASSLQRELAGLSDAGIITRRQDGNRVYYTANTDCAVYSELSKLFNNSTGLVAILQRELAPFDDNIELALVFGSMANGTATDQSDIDLLIVGGVTPKQLVKPLVRVEDAAGHSVDLVHMSEREFRRRIAANDKLLRSVLDNDVLFVVNDRDGLADLTGPRQDRGDRAKQRRS